MVGISVDPVGAVLAVAAVATDRGDAGGRARSVGLQTAEARVTAGATIAAGRARERSGVGGRVIAVATDAAVAAVAGRSAGARRGVVSATGVTTGATDTGVAASATVAACAAVHGRCRARDTRRAISAVGTGTAGATDTSDTMRPGGGAGSADTTIAARTAVAARGARRRAVGERVITATTLGAITTVTAAAVGSTRDAIGR